MYYLLAFNSHITHQEFNLICEQRLNKLGYIFFHWTPTVRSSMESLGFKVWLEILDLPPHYWSVQEIPTLATFFGLVLTHTPLAEVASFERLRLCVATNNLSRVPHNLELFLNG
jgi:hypothetical protein